MGRALVGSILLLKAHTDYERLVLVLAGTFGFHWIALTVTWRLCANTLEHDITKPASEELPSRSE